MSVVSGHIRGKTNTLPLAVEALYSEYRFSEAFALATLLLSLSVVTLILKRLIETKARQDAKLQEAGPGE